MANLTGFDASTVAPREDYTPLPTGEYIVQMTDSDMKPTKANDGEYLECTFEVQEGQFKGRKLWSRLNLVNKNPKAQEIAQRDLSAICHAVGKLQPRDSQELHYKPLVVRVEYVVADGIKRTSDSSEIRAYKALPAGAARTQAPAAAPAASATAAPATTPPWANASAS